MNGYPADYVYHNLPLILLSGLEPQPPPDRETSHSSPPVLQEGGFRLRVDLPILESRLASELLHTFLQHDASEEPWHPAAADVQGKSGVWRIRSVGRVGQTHPPPFFVKPRGCFDGSRANAWPRYLLFLHVKPHHPLMHLGHGPTRTAKARLVH